MLPDRAAEPPPPRWSLAAVTHGVGVRTVRGPWDDRIGAEMRARGVTGLELNVGKGWRGGDLGFLAGLGDQLEHLILIDLTAKDVAPVHHLPRLVTLQVETYDRTPLDFAAFPRLRCCGLEWRARSRSLFACRTLERLVINHYPGEDVEAFADLTNLEALSLLSPRVKHLRGIDRLIRLRFLGLYRARGLTDLTPLGRVDALTELEINDCRKLSSIDQLAGLRSLQRLMLCNDGAIASLAPLAGLHALREVFFFDSTDVVDGDLSPLLGLARLERVAFQERPHYSHRRGDFAGRAA